MTIELPTGVTVHVEFPQRCPEVRPPSVPEPGPITVPVQGSLTAEQFAHIVATVTAKVVEELGGQPGGVTWDAVQDRPVVFPPAAHRHNAADIDDLPSGGGGAGIDDTTIGTDTTWSSQKIVADRAPAVVTLLNPDGTPGDDVAVADIIPGLMTSLMQAVLWEPGPIAPQPGIALRSEMPERPGMNKLYAIRADDGTVTWHMPNIWV
ncbi:hypothetical protein GS575_09510 [Rhodococcus hoagii]|nr:hypothetical protein [Prescottella equi]